MNGISFREFDIIGVKFKLVPFLCWFAGICLLLYILFQSIPRTPAPVAVVQPVAPVPTPAPVAPVDTSSSWAKCIDFTGKTVDPKHYEILLRNTCGVGLDMFYVYYKFYDSQDERVGWDNETIGRLEVGERVRFQKVYPKDNPALERYGVATIKADTYEKYDK